eukprot:NODE_327_length_9598_cov_1.179914.p4 type:complete len:199 gc:universal NODE_327_length_9598_cov_1.179914:8355-8951(+)
MNEFLLTNGCLILITGKLLGGSSPKRQRTHYPQMAKIPPISILNDCFSKNLIYQEINDTIYTFYRDYNGIQTSFVDHIIVPTLPQLKITDTGSIPVTTSYHSLNFCDVQCGEIHLLQKNSRIKSYKLKDEDTQFYFQQYQNANCSKIKSIIYSCLNNFPYVRQQHETNDSSIRDKLTTAIDNIQHIIIDSGWNIVRIF